MKNSKNPSQKNCFKNTYDDDNIPQSDLPQSRNCTRSSAKNSYSNSTQDSSKTSAKNASKTSSSSSTKDLTNDPLKDFARVTNKSGKNSYGK